MAKVLSDVQGSSETVVGESGEVRTPMHVMLIGPDGAPVTSLGGTLFATLLVSFVTTGTVLADV